RKRTERMEAVEGEAAQRVGAADERGIAEPGTDQPRRRGEGLTARRAGGVDRVGRAAEPVELGDEGREIARFLLRVAKALRPGARAKARRDGRLALGDAGGAGPEDDGDALGAVAAMRRGDLGRDLGEGERSQTIVAAIEAAQR